MIADFEQVFGSVDDFHAASNGFGTVNTLLIGG